METVHDQFIAELPKAELHLHIEGTLTAETVWKLAGRNGIKLPYASPEEIEASRIFTAPDAPSYLSKFLAAYFEGLDVLRTEQDFYDVTVDYLKKCKAENVVHAEISFDPQAHTSRGVPFEAFISGLTSGQRYADENLGVSSVLIMCINRDRGVDSAEAMYRDARPFRDAITGLGLDSLEEGNPPVKYRDVYARAKADGFRLTAHCDVDQRNSVAHIWQCLDELDVDRIDHGINAIEDPRLVEALCDREICLTPCPTWRTSDIAPRRMDRIRMMDELGLRVTVNSDDPGLFPSATLGFMLPYVAAEGNLEPDDLVRLMENAFLGGWMSDDRRRECLSALERYRETEDS